MNFRCDEKKKILKTSNIDLLKTGLKKRYGAGFARGREREREEKKVGVGSGNF